MLIFEITEMKTTDYVDQKEFVTHVQELGGSKEVGVKMLAAFKFFQKQSEENFYDIEEQMGGYVVQGKKFKDFVSAVQYAKSQGLGDGSVQSVWNWKEDPKSYTQSPEMVNLRKFVQDRLQQTLNDGEVPIHIIHFDQDDEMRPLFRLNLNTNEGTRCWKGYKKKGMKTMFGKRVPNCVKNEDIEAFENLRDWFGKGKKGGAGGGGWDRYNTKGERIGKCGDSKKGEGKPKCLSKSRAASLRAKGGKAAIGAAVRKKRRNDPNKNRRGKAKNVSNTTRSSKKK